MKKIITGLVVAVFFLTITFIVIEIGNKLNKGKIIKEHISKLPEFSFTTLQNTSFNSSSITQGPVLIIRYHPECEHCQYEISELIKSKILASGIKILLISDADKNEIIKFLDESHINDIPEMIPLLDTASVFSDVFGRDIVPSNYIYDQELKLVKVFNGEVKIETILKYLAEIE
jgi:thiol-disulfide isomerase/thioredoxin